MTTYRFTMPTPEVAKAKGIRLEGMETRTRLWLMGIAFANSSLTGSPFSVVFSTPTSFSIVTDQTKLVDDIKDWLDSYGYTCEMSLTPA